MKRVIILILCIGVLLGCERKVDQDVPVPSPVSEEEQTSSGIQIETSADDPELKNEQETPPDILETREAQLRIARDVLSPREYEILETRSAQSLGLTLDQDPLQ